MKTQPCIHPTTSVISATRRLASIVRIATQLIFEGEIKIQKGPVQCAPTLCEIITNGKIKTVLCGQGCQRRALTPWHACCTALRIAVECKLGPCKQPLFSASAQEDWQAGAAKLRPNANSHVAIKILRAPCPKSGAEQSRTFFSAEILTRQVFHSTKSRFRRKDDVGASAG